MEALFITLKWILEKQLMILTQMTEIAREHRRALCQLDIEALKEVLQNQEDLSKLFKLQEIRRRDIAVRMAKLSNLPEDTSLGAYLKKSPMYLRASLNGLMENIVRAVKEIEEINALNNMLTKQAMRVNELIFKTINGVDGQFYTPQGVVEGKSSFSLLDKKA